MRLRKFAAAVMSICMFVSLNVFSVSASGGVGFSVKKQVYPDDGSIIEVLYFTSDGTDREVTKQISMINDDIAKTVGRDMNVYFNESTEPDFEDIFDIRAYPIVSEKYVQLVATSADYPSTGDPDVFSWAFNKETGKYMRLSDALITDKLTEDRILTDAEKLYKPFGDSDYLYGGEVRGFYITKDAIIHYLLIMHMKNPSGEDLDTFMVYVPGRYYKSGNAHLYQSGMERFLTDNVFSEFTPPLKCN
jgi:hypothetical protein